MTKEIKRIVVTGGAGQIAYSLLFRIAHGDLLGYDQPIALHILEIPEAIEALEGVKMELLDCAFPLLKEIVIGSDARKVFQGVHYAFLVGAKPRGPGMERGDLLQENGKIFITQGKALNESADKDVKVLVVGNPCNTNCLIAMTHAPSIPRKNFYAMTRLDQNRAVAQLAIKAKAPVSEISNMVIWGNHSTTQVPDYFHVKIHGKPLNDVLTDHHWLKTDFITTVQNRGAEVIKKRGKSSAASAANAAIDAMKDIIFPTPSGHYYSSGVVSDGNPYGIKENLIYSFPCVTDRNGHCTIVPNLPLKDFISEKIHASEKELLDERNMVLNFEKK